VHGRLTIRKLTKTPQIYIVSYFNLGGLELCLGGKPTKAPGLLQSIILISSSYPHARSQVSRFGGAQYIFRGVRFLLLLYV